ncbi:MAG: serine/threonine protein kinase [Alphaproteobacteria bacterium]|nr:serine/threonine protein kinase [Alphaproteobacteria bacterium]
MATIHATCIAAPGGGPAVLLRGAPGSGKSDLALRLIDQGWRLVADDRTMIETEAGRVTATAPAEIAGRLEVRGIGIVSVPHVARACVSLVVDLVAPTEIDRLPEALTCTVAGVELPLIRLAPFEASAVAKVRLAVQAATGG